jgi:hypothetical protein
MSSILDLYSSEPLIVNGAVTGVVDAVIFLAVSFGLHISQAQTQGIDGLVAAVSLVALLLISRRQVIPVAKIAATPPLLAVGPTPPTPPVIPPAS